MMLANRCHLHGGHLRQAATRPLVTVMTEIGVPVTDLKAGDFTVLMTVRRGAWNRRSPQ
jgi:hypothetical protein